MRCNSRKNRSDYKDQCGQQDHLAPTKAIRELARKRSAKDCAKHDRRGDPADNARIPVEIPVVLEKRQSSCHNPDVIAEQNPAEGSKKVDKRTWNFLFSDSIVFHECPSYS